MDSTRFDDLTKALANATSRRQALRRIGGILGGTALAGILPGLAFASNNTCAHFCDAVFGADTPAASQCISDAAHGKGLCHTCGSVAPSSICCNRNASNYCSSYSGASCPCDSSQCQLCQNGTCVSTCSPNQTCQNGQCVSTYPYECFCWDGFDTGSICMPTPCTLANVDGFCDQVCANHGGWQDSQCSIIPC